MKTCKECHRGFVPKRKEQVFCSVTCRQQVNGRKRKGQKTGPREGWEYKARINRDGYEMIYAGNHPYADGRKMIAKHIAIVEVMQGSRLNPGECVHHKDGNRLNNDKDNLMVMSHAEHSRQHNRELVKNRKRVGGRFA